MDLGWVTEAVGGVVYHSQVVDIFGTFSLPSGRLALFFHRNHCFVMIWGGKIRGMTLWSVTKHFMQLSTG